MERRDFIKISSILTAGSTVLTSCGKDMRQTIVSTIPDNQMVIGEEHRAQSVCTGCGAECGVEVRVVDGRAVKLEGLADHPVNRGRLCARGQSELQLLYNPDRIKGPMVAGKSVTWEVALAALAEKLKSVDPMAVAFVTGQISAALAASIDDFLTRLGAPPRVDMEPLSERAVRHAQTTWDFSDYNYVLSFGAPLIESGPSPVQAQRTLAHMRQGRPGLRGKLVQVESRYSLTAAYADEWIFVNPGTEGALALAIDGSMPVEQAGSLTGVKAERITRIAREFRAHGPAIAVVGGAAAGYANAASTADAAIGLNLSQSAGTLATLLAGRFQALSAAGKNAPLSVPTSVAHEVAAIGSARPDDSATRTLADIAGKSELQHVVFVAGCNPLFEAPGAIAPGAFIVSFASFPDETADTAHVVLPNHTALESAHGDMKAAVRPLYDTRDASDTLTTLAEKLDRPAVAIKVPARAANTSSRPKPTPLKEWARTHQEWTPPTFHGNGEFHFQVYAGLALGTGASANVPWLQELPDPMTQSVWTSALEMNPKTAARMGLSDGDSVIVESPRGKITTRITINPSAAPNVVSMSAGQGHTALGRYAKDRGANPYALIDHAQWAATRVNVRKA